MSEHATSGTLVQELVSHAPALILMLQELLELLCMIRSSSTEEGFRLVPLAAVTGRRVL
jgi:hypothetical protein